VQAAAARAAGGGAGAARQLVQGRIRRHAGRERDRERAFARPLLDLFVTSSQVFIVLM
jgi:hypothetical protein